MSGRAAERWATLWREPEPEQLRAIYLEGVRTTPTGLLTNAAIAALFWSHSPVAATVGWLLAATVAQLLLLVICRRYRHDARRDERRRHYARLAAAMVGLLGLAKGISIWVFHVPGAWMYDAALHIALTGSAMVGVLFLSSHWPSMIAFIGGLLLPVIARDLSRGTEVHWMLGSLAVLLLVALLVAGAGRARVMLELLRTRNEKQALAQALAHEVHETQAAREAAERANRVKSRLVAAVNHDLRQPVHSLALFAQVLRERPADAAYLAQQMQACVDNLAALLDELQGLGELDEPSLRASLTEVPLQPLLDEIVAVFAPQASRHRLTLQAPPLSPPALAVRADRRLLLRALSNLVANALRYTVEGTVSLTARQDGEQVRIDVHDTGVGIAEADQQRVFDEFCQLGNAPPGRSPGTGLGLAIVKRAADAMGARVALESRVGEGSCFSLWLPVAHATSAPLPQRLLASDPMAGRRVLVLDDDHRVRESLSLLLDGWGCEVRQAASVDEARRLVDAAPERTDCVISDLWLANGDNGADAVQALRAARPALKALLITADTQHEGLQHLRASGVPVLPKPVRAAQLRAALARVFAQA